MGERVLLGVSHDEHAQVLQVRVVAGVEGGHCLGLSARLLLSALSLHARSVHRDVVHIVKHCHAVVVLSAIVSMSSTACSSAQGAQLVCGGALAALFEQSEGRGGQHAVGKAAVAQQIGLLLQHGQRQHQHGLRGAQSTPLLQTRRQIVA